MKWTLLLLMSLSAYAELPPMEFTPYKPIEFKPMKDPAKYPEGISFTCEAANQQWLLFRNEKRTSAGGVQFQSQSILTFDVEQNCLDQAEQLNSSAENIQN